MTPTAHLLADGIVYTLAVLGVIAAWRQKPEKPEDDLLADLLTERERMLKRAEQQVLRDANMIEAAQIKPKENA